MNISCWVFSKKLSLQKLRKSSSTTAACSRPQDAATTAVWKQLPFFFYLTVCFWPQKWFKINKFFDFSIFSFTSFLHFLTVFWHVFKVFLRHFLAPKLQCATKNTVYNCFIVPHTVKCINVLCDELWSIVCKLLVIATKENKVGYFGIFLVHLPSWLPESSTGLESKIELKLFEFSRYFQENWNGNFKMNKIPQNYERLLKARENSFERFCFRTLCNCVCIVSHIDFVGLE